jgi:hypothetical protein
VAWNDVSFDFGSILTSAKMNQMMDNLNALAAGTGGAPKIQDAALDGWRWNSADLNHNIITRQKLATTTTAQTGTIAGGGSQLITLPAYCFAWSLIQTGGFGGPFTIQSDEVNPANADAPKFIIVNEEPTASADFSVAYRYILGP